MKNFKHIFRLLMVSILASFMTLGSFSDLAQARSMRGFGEYLQQEISQVERALDQSEAEDRNVELIEGFRLTSFRLLLQALFGWKFPGLISVTIYPQIELMFDHVPVE